MAEDPNKKTGKTSAPVQPKTKSQPETLQKIKSSVFSRSLSLAKLTVNTSARFTGHQVGSLFRNKEQKEQSWKDFLSQQSSVLSTELGELKGSLMKAGQMLSMFGEQFLPKEANDFLKTLQSDSKPLDFRQMQKLLDKNMSPEQLAELEINPDSIGTASLGQVHVATVKSTKQKIALKIQYPDVENAIDSDLKALKFFLNTLKLLPQDLDMGPLFQEVQEMLKEETDYTLEKNKTIEYKKLIGDDSRFLVPEIYERYSSKRILASEYLPGLRADDRLIQGLSQERRNQLALNYLDLYFKELFTWGVVQTDPHVGNYKIRLSPTGQDQLILLDFGATRKYEEAFLSNYRKMVKACVVDDQDKLEEYARRLNFVESTDPEELKTLFKDFCLATVEPFLEPTDRRTNPAMMDKDGNYDWKNSDLPKRLSQMVWRILQTFKLRSPPREILFLDRKTGGVFVFLSVLRANMNSREVLMKYLNQVDLD